MNTITSIALGICIITCLAYIFMTFFTHTHKKDKTPNIKLVQLNSKIYLLFNKIPYISAKFQIIRLKIYNNKLGEDWYIRYKTIQYYFLSWIVALGAAIFVIFYYHDNVYVTLTLLFFSYQVKEMTLNTLIGDDTNLLAGLYNYGEELQQNFSTCKDVIQSIIEANKTATNAIVIRHMTKMQSVLDDTVEYNEYIENCPNIFFKLLAINCRLINEYGDKKDADGKSAFMDNIKYIRQDIETEVTKRRNLKYWLKRLPLLCVVPLLVFTPYEYWAHSMLNVTDIVYKTSIGFVLKLLITIVSIICFYIIKSYNNINQAPINISKRYWEQSLLKFKPVRYLLKWISPSTKSRKYYRYKDLIVKSGEFTKVEYIYIKKILFAVFGFILSLSVFISIHHINYNNIYNDQNSKFSSSVIAVGLNQVDSVKTENEMLKYVNIKNTEKSVSEISAKLNQQGILDSAVINSLTAKIINKKIALENEHLKWYEVILSVLGAVICWFIPNFALKIKADERKYQMEDEVVIFETIILILMYHETATPELILKTMYNTSSVFKQPLDYIYKQYTKGDTEKIEDMISNMYRPFANLIKNVLKTDSIRSNEAFVNLAENRKSNIDIRKENNSRLIKKRVSKAQIIALIPLNCIIFIYIAGAFMFVAYKNVINIDKQINHFDQTNQIEDVQIK